VDPCRNEEGEENQGLTIESAKSRGGTLSVYIWSGNADLRPPPKIRYGRPALILKKKKNKKG